MSTNKLPIHPIHENEPKDEGYVIQNLEELTGEIDYVYQEGMRFTKDEIKKLRACINTLDGICNDLEDDTLQSYLNQVK